MDIIEAKYKSKRFFEMDFSELDRWTKALLLKIHSITGWVIPDNGMYKILVDQFRKKIGESYFNCNPDEIEFAFRNYGTMVKDWGKNMNLSLIDEVMREYLERRFEVSRHEEQMADKSVLQMEYKEDLSDKAMMDWYNSTHKKYTEDKDAKFEFLPLMIYDWLVNSGRINKANKEKNAYMKEAVLYRNRMLENRLINENSLDNQKLAKEFKEMMKNSKYSDSEFSILKGISKRMILSDVILKNEVSF